MAENLNYETGKSWCYENEASNCDKYGRLYAWSAVMDSAGIVDPNGAGRGCGYGVECKVAELAEVRGICPEGWHVPTNEEYSTLFTYIGGSSIAGLLLKSTSGWYNSGNSSDMYGFSGLPAGYRYNMAISTMRAITPTCGLPLSSIVAMRGARTSTTIATAPTSTAILRTTVKVCVASRTKKL